MNPLIKDELITMLGQRYDAQKLRYPLLPLSVSRAQYIAVNLPYAYHNRGGIPNGHTCSVIDCQRICDHHAAYCDVCWVVLENL